MSSALKMKSIERLLLSSYFQGFRQTTDLNLKREFFSKAEEIASSCTREYPEFSPCWFWAGVHLALLQETRGAISFVSHWRLIRSRLETAARLDAHYLNGGPARTLGKIQSQLPEFLGGGFEAARQSYRSAIQADGQEPLNWLFLIQLLKKNGAASESELVEALHQASTLTQPPPERLESTEAWQEIQVASGVPQGGPRLLSQSF